MLRFAFCGCVYSWYRTKLQTMKSAVCHGSTILSADFLGQLNHAHKSSPTLLIVWHPLKRAGRAFYRRQLSVKYLNLHSLWTWASVNTTERTFRPICRPICCSAISHSGALHVEYNIRSLIVQLYPGIEYINTAPATTAQTQKSTQLFIHTNDILFINRLTALPSATGRPAILSSRDRSIAGYS